MYILFYEQAVCRRGTTEKCLLDSKGVIGTLAVQCKSKTRDNISTFQRAEQKRLKKVNFRIVIS